MSHFGALRRRSPAFKGVLLATGLSLLLVAALSLQSGGKPDGAASQPSVAPSRVTAPTPRAAASEQLPVALTPSPAPAGRAAPVVAPSRPQAPVSARAGADADADATTLVGKTVMGNVVAQGKSVPLPAGQWIVVAHVPAPGPGGVESLFLVQVRRDKVSRAVLVEAGTQAGDPAMGFPRLAQCARQGLLYVKTISNEEFGRQDCWTIDHDVSTGSERDASPIIRAAIAELERRGVKYPPVRLSAFFGLADRQSFLHAVYDFNPETDGITSKSALWDESDWNRNHIYQSPDKIAYVEKLRAWAEAWHLAVREGFQGGLSEAARKP
jgi:hypothetical protein